MECIIFILDGAVSFFFLRFRVVKSCGWRFWVCVVCIDFLLMNMGVWVICCFLSEFKFCCFGKFYNELFWRGFLCFLGRVVELLLRCFFYGIWC
ncbi:hypothetical protein BC829DRAFT_390940 [Chytridium lagenaria]|nr:hypothetical protein BC829DRAFT_390940 [Chytridium lagenaria]